MGFLSVRMQRFVQWLHALQHRIDCMRFAPSRVDYYGYLSALLQGMQGSRTLKSVFDMDAHRYGPRSVRGRLSLYWSQAYQVAGGDLYSTWLYSFPQAELGVLRAAQAYGSTALLNALGELAAVLRLAEKSRHILVSTLWAGAVALLMLCVMLLLVPVFTLPSLLHTFSAVPAEYYGRLTVMLLRFSGLIETYWAFVAVLLAGGWLVGLWSLPNTSGALRHRLDRHAFWRLYRTIHALRFFSVLAVLLARDEVGSTQLRAALSMQKMGASRWLNGYIDLMLARIDSGMAGASTFEVGLLDRIHFWFLSDMVLARGLHQGLVLSTERLAQHVLEVTARQALMLRWCLLLGCLAGLLGLGLWHYAVIDELRRSLMLFYASQ